MVSLSFSAISPDKLSRLLDIDGAPVIGEAPCEQQGSKVDHRRAVVRLIEVEAGDYSLPVIHENVVAMHVVVDDCPEQRVISTH
jgi:hypothetical protein